MHDANRVWVGQNRPGRSCRAASVADFCSRALKSPRRRAESMGMRPKTRLDSVIKLEEENEERRLREMAAAGRQVKSAEAALTGARDAAATDHRRASSATDWMVAEIAHTRALLDVRSAENAVKSATAAEGASRHAYTQAHSKAEALRRVAQARVDEILTTREKAESKELDDIGLISFNSGPRAA
jgi:hypothetical protein